MGNNPKILCVIPARGGSKGIRNKNIKKLKKKELIFYTIDFAMNFKDVLDIVVSTDSKKIRNIVNKKYINLIKNLRPKRLATDDALTTDVIKYELEKKEKKGFNYNYILLLQPTVPYRRVSDLKKCLKIIDSKKFDSCITICDVGANHPHRMKILRKNYLKNFCNLKKESMTPRHLLPKVYIRSGSIYLISKKSFFKYNSLVGKKCTGLVVDGKYSINIDQIFDFELAQKQ